MHPLVGAFEKLRKKRLLTKSYLSVSSFFRPHGTTRLSMDGSSWDLVFQDFSNYCWENSIFFGYFTYRPMYLRYLALFFVKWEVFQANLVEEINTYIS